MTAIACPVARMSAIDLTGQAQGRVILRAPATLASGTCLPELGRAQPVVGRPTEGPDGKPSAQTDLRQGGKDTQVEGRNDLAYAIVTGPGIDLDIARSIDPSLQGPTLPAPRGSRCRNPMFS